MIAFQLILKSYFKRDFDSIASAIMAPFFLLAGLAAALVSINHGAERSAPHVLILIALILAVCYSTFVVAYGLRHVLETGTGHLYPRFRQRHMQVSALALAPFLIIPVVVLCLAGYPVLNATALLLLACSLTAWIILKLGNTMFSGLVMMLMLRAAYELLGLAEKPIIMRGLISMTVPYQKRAIPLLLIAVAALLMVVFVRYASTMQPRREPEKSYPYAGLLPTPLHAPQRLIHTTLAKLHRRASWDDSPGMLSKLIRLTLFSPGYAFTSLYLIRWFPFYTAIALAFSVLLYAIGISVDSDTLQNHELVTSSVVFTVYHFMAFALSTDFLIHRVQLPSIWLAGRCSSRRHFIASVVRCYMGVAARMYFWPTALLLAVAGLTPWLRLELAGGVAAMGLAAFVNLVALSLSMSGSIQSQNCSGWVIPNFLVLVILLQMLQIHGFFNHLPTVWATSALLLFMGVLLMLIGIATLYRTELSFKGPEI
jgi:hypothetical protein